MFAVATTHMGHSLPQGWCMSSHARAVPSTRCQGCYRQTRRGFSSCYSPSPTISCCMASVDWQKMCDGPRDCVTTTHQMRHWLSHAMLPLQLMLQGVLLASIDCSNRCFCWHDVPIKHYLDAASACIIAASRCRRKPCFAR